MANRMKRKSYVTALLVGTALGAMGSASASACDAVPATRDLSRYCTSCWRNARIQPDRWEDCTQEVLVRLLERVQPSHWDRILSSEGDDRREFLRAIDAVKKRTQRAKKAISLDADVPADRNHHEDVAEQRQTLLHLSQQHLNLRQERIVRLTLDGWNVSEIADRLDLPAARVSDEKYKAIQKLRQLVA